MDAVLGAWQYIVMPTLWLGVIGLCLVLLDWQTDRVASRGLVRLWRMLRDVRITPPHPHHHGHHGAREPEGPGSAHATERLNRLSGGSVSLRITAHQRGLLADVFHLDEATIHTLDEALAADDRKAAHRILSRARNGVLRRTGGWRVVAGVVTGNNHDLNRLLLSFDALREDWGL